MHPDIARGIALFNSRRFFEAHEALESLWLKEQGDEKLFLHGLIQVAAAFHHYLRGNGEGFRSLLEKGAKKLALYAGNHYGIDLEDFQKQIRPWLAAAQAQESAATTLPLPVIRAL
jgi:predicted metal-dependent hydrolase